jgi:hypothetical protein
MPKVDIAPHSSIGRYKKFVMSRAEIEEPETLPREVAIP